MNRLASRVKNDINELLFLQTSCQKSASSIELVSDSLNIQVNTDQSYASVLVEITPGHEEMIWAAYLNKINGDEGSTTFEVEEYFSGDKYYARVEFGNITGGSVSAILTVIATDNFRMEIING